MVKTAKKHDGNGRFRWSIMALLLGIVFSFTALILFFNQFSSRYQKNVELETSSHLLEITNQVCAYIQDNVNNQWIIAENIADGLNIYIFDQPEDLRRLLLQTRDQWHVTDIFVYTNDGASYSLDSGSKHNDVSSDLVYNARKVKRYLSIEQSTVTYTVPVDTDALYYGSQIVALSIVQNMETLISDMDVSSFGGTTSLFLAHENGTTIGQNRPEGLAPLYNVYSIFDAASTVCINQPDFVMDGILPNNSMYSFLLRGADGNQYVVSDTLCAGDNVLRLFYCVPEESANANTHQFVSAITSLTVGVSVVFLLIAGAFFILLYMNQRKVLNQELDMRQRMLDLLVANTSDAFVLLSLQSDEPLYISSNIEKITGISAFKLLKTAEGFAIKTTENQAPANIARINQQLTKWDGRMEYISPYLPYQDSLGQIRYFMMRLYATEKSDVFILIAQDVTKEQEREQELKMALSMADSANQAKTRFLSNMSHDIRTPMNAIVNMTDFALEAIDEKEALTEYLNTTKESAQHLLSLINNILDMSRIESGREYIDNAPFDLSECLLGVSKIIESVCVQKGMRFSCEVEPMAHHQLIGDKLKLSQILINILNNAVKFTPPDGEVRFVVTKLPSIKKQSVSIRFEVMDTGIGIAADHLETIFDPFVRETQADSKQIEGNGLGLSICKNYAAAMGGRIFCTSELGRGSKFTVELPFTVSENVVQKAQHTQEKRPVQTTENLFAGKRALLCEDHPINQQIAKKLLGRLGFTVEVADNGQIGFEKFAASSPNTFDIIYMDIQMPVMNGYEAAAAIRASHHPQAAAIPILAMTANVFAEDVEKVRIAGMNGHIGKPIVISILIAVTKEALGKEKQENEKG